MKKRKQGEVPPDQGGLGLGVESPFGVLQVSSPPPLPESLKDLGMDFITKTRQTPEATDDGNGVTEQVDTRTDEDIRREMHAQIANLLDLPQDVIDEARKRTTASIEEVRDYVMLEVVPLVLAVEPALTAVSRMIPKCFDEGSEVSVSMPTEQLRAFVASAASVKARLFFLEKLGLPNDVRQRFLNRMLPDKEVSRVTDKPNGLG